VRATEAYFQPWETIHEANPHHILQRGERVDLPPLLIMQGGLDDNVVPTTQRRFADAYRAAGGECTYELFEDCEHEWTATDSPQTSRAHAIVRSFIARNMAV
jgi:dipeptidyl aminopeptidase/acylaminoacyl peptidase